jgi:hypothetical protein
MPSEVDADDPVPRLQVLVQGTHVPVVAAHPVHEQDRRFAAARLLVGEADTIAERVLHTHRS